jgi:hypothetical protein
MLRIWYNNLPIPYLLAIWNIDIIAGVLGRNSFIRHDFDEVHYLTQYPQLSLALLNLLLERLVLLTNDRDGGKRIYKSGHKVKCVWARKW